MPPTPNRVAAIDGLRGIACLSVVLGHYFVQPYASSLKAAAPLLGAVLTKFGWGVDLFFVVSGFLIGGILLDHRNSPGLLRAFYLRRILRIWPLYYLLVLAVMGVHYLNGSLVAHPVPFWSYLLFIHNYWMAAGYNHLFIAGALWSISMEEHFYLIAPLALKSASLGRASWTIAATISGALLCRLLAQFGWLQFDFGGFLSMADTIAIGLLGALLIRQERIRLLLSHSKAQFASLPILGLILALATLDLGPAAAWPLKWLLPDVRALCFLSLVILVTLHEQGWFPRILRCPLLTIPGTYCYFLYLFHLVVILNLHELVESGLITSRIALRFIALAVLLATAAFSWRYLESPLIAWARRKWNYQG